MSAKNIDILLRNNTGNKDKSSLIEGFVVRTRVFNSLFEELRRQSSDKPEQNYLVIGQRGAGKTTLLYRLKYAIEDDPILSKMIIPVMFSEEQYHLTELVNLWETIIEYLEDWQKWEGISEEANRLIEKSKFPEEAVFDLLTSTLQSHNKKIIVFIENLNVFFKKIGVEQQKRLREVLMTSTSIRLIASSTSYFDGVIDYNKPFYDFFKIIHIDGLDSEECKKLLLKIGEQYGEREQIEHIIEKSPQRIESLRRLTGGVPRTISYLFQIFLDNENGKAIKDLYQLIDTLSFLYKAELDQLSTQQQKVVDIIARSWDAIGVKEIARLTRYDSKNISSILNTLEKNQVIEIVPTKTKNNLYRIRERFMNIWYLMRFGKKNDKESILWLVRFYDVWCDQTELIKRIAEHIGNLKDGKYDIDAAIDMGNTFMACENVSEELKYNVYETTSSILPRNQIQSLKISDSVLYKKINEFFKKKQEDKVAQLLDAIEVKDKKYYDLLAWATYRKGDFVKSEEANLKSLSFDQHDGATAFRIGFLNEEFLQNEEKAREYYKLAFDNHNFLAAKSLGEMYYEKEDFEEAEKYLTIALDNGVNAGPLLAITYFRLDKLDEAEILLNKAVKENIPGALNNLGLVLHKKEKYREAIDAFTKSIEKGHDESLINLGLLYMEQPEPDVQSAKVCFETAAEKNIKQSFVLLGKLYAENLKDESKAIHYYEKGVQAGDADAAHNLAHIYDNLQKYEESDSLFIRSSELGRPGSLICLTRSIIIDKRNDRKEFILNVLEKNIDAIDACGVKGRLEYAVVLLWNGLIEKSLQIFSGSLESVKEIFDTAEDDDIETTLSDVSNYLMFLLSKGQYKAAYSLFHATEQIDLKQIAKPLYYALMNFMKKEYPTEYLKAGNELKEAVSEIIAAIDKMRKEYN